MLASVRGRPGDDILPHAVASGFLEVADGLRAQFAPTAKAPLVVVTFPRRATSPLRIVDSASGIGVDVGVVGARNVEAETADGYVVYRKAHGTAAALLHRASPEGVEDFVSFDTRPRTPVVSYKLALLEGVAGLRMVAGTLELLDAGGAPRLRVEPPFIVGADGERTEAALAVRGCAFDKNPAGPWGRPVTAPGARSCTLRVSWDDDRVSYPAILDPKWTSSSNNMASARQGHTATLLSTGKVLVVGGRTSGTSTTGLDTADLFDPATNTWSPTGGLGTGGRFSHTATQLNTGSNPNTSGKVMIAGGINGSTIAATWQLYNVTAGTWSLVQTSIGVARHQHTATLLPNGNVLIAGGTATTGVTGSAAIYNPGGSSNGSWSPVSTNMAARRFHTATLLNSSSNTNFSNRVLFLGGNSGGTTSVSTYQLFNTSALTWSTATTLPAPGAREGHTATKLAIGNVLITGGKAGSAPPKQDSFVFTIPASGSTPTFPSAGTLSVPRWGHTATLLPTGILTDGQVLLAGGSSNGTTSIASAELWNGTATWTPSTANLVNPLRVHTATLLASGKVLVAGGINSTTVSNGQVYDPSLGRSCTTGTQCATGFCVSGACCDTACTGQCQACNVTGAIGTCSPKPNNPACNDSDACTTGETCQSNGQCAGGTTVTCTPSNPCQIAGTCSPASGCPAPTNKPNGTGCDDADACTNGTTCTGGSCTGGSTVTCTTSNPCQVAGTCSPASGCPAPANKPNGTACDDGSACTQGDVCTAGTCQGPTTFSCVAPDTCHAAGTCNSAAPSPPPPSTQDLIGWWKLDGDGADASGGGHNLTIEGNVTPASGRVGTGMKFDGTSCMTVPIWDEARMQGANGVTLMAWISPDPAQVCSSLAQESVMGNGWDYSMGMWCHVNGGRPPVMAARQAGAQTWGYPGGGSNATPGQWSHVAVVWDRSKLMIYQNGQLMIQYPNPGDFANGESLFAIGCMITSYYQSNDRVQHFSGAVDEAMLYRRVLSSAEIAAYYTAADPCPHAQLANGTNCNDNDLCTLSDTCSNGTCVGSNPKVCSASDQCHVAGTCAPGTGVCSNPPISGGFVCDGAFPIAYHLSEDVRVSINIYDASGAVVRELLRAVPQQAGDHTMVWDGLDRNGKAAPAGSYSWKLLGTHGLSAQYLAKVGDNYPIGTDGSSSGGPGTHNAPFTVASDATGTYVAANGTENQESGLIKLGVDGETRPWSQVLPEPEHVEWDGARSLAVDGGNVFLLGRLNPQHVYVSDATSGIGLRKFSVDWDSIGDDRSDFVDEVLHGATDMDVRNDVLVVAYRAQDTIRWYDPATGTPSPLEAAVASPAGVAVGNDGTVFVSTAGGVSTLSHADHNLHSFVPSGFLASPGRLDVDHTTGDVLVYDEGTRRIVRFGANGVWKATYGRAGGRLDGPYVAGDFLAVTDVSADGSGGFYVAESYSAPRRVAHFASNGSLIKEWYGGQPWSSHAAFDPDDPSVLWVSSARSKDLMSRYVMRVVVNYAQRTWTVDSTYRYYDHSDPNSGLAYTHDSGNERGLFHIYKRAATGVKYFVIEGWPSILRIDEAQSKLIPVTGSNADGTIQWNDRNDGDGLVQANELIPYTGSGGPWFHISHVDSDFNHYFVTGSYPCEVRRWVPDWTEAGVPIYPSDKSGELVGTCPMRFADGGIADPRWGTFLFHDTQTNSLYAALNSGGVQSTGVPIITDPFLQHWNAAGQTTWGVGQRSNAAEVGGDLILAPTEPGSIYWSLRGLAGVTHGAIVATDYNGGWKGESAHTYVWDQDGLYVGGIMDNIDLSAAPSFMYACAGEFAHSTLYNAPNGDVYFAGAWENDMRIYKVTGWDNWIRKSGTLSLGTAGQDNAGTGLAATYFDNRDFTDARTVRVDGPINFNWGSSIPPGTALTSADTYGVRWLGTVQASYGPKYTGFWQVVPDGTASEGGYHKAQASGASVECKFSGDSIQVFGITGPTSGRVNILVDGQIVASNIDLATPTRQQRSIFDWSFSGGGDHTVTVYAIPVQGLTAGTVDIDHFVASGTTIDDNGLPYRFYVASDDGAQLWVNNACVIYDWTPKSASSERATAQIKLLRNGLPIELSYFKDTGGTATIDLQWESPVNAKQDVPATALRAATAYPIAEMSSGFQRIDQLDQTTSGAWQGHYGADGHAFGNAFALPSYVSLVESRPPFHYIPGPETKYLTGAAFGWHCGWEDCTQPTDRIPTTLEFSFSDRDWHKLSLYLMDLSNGVGPISAMDLTLTDLGGNVDTRTVNGADFVNGAYVAWNVRGYVKVTATRTPGATGWLGAAAIYGAFLDPPIGVTTSGMLVSGNGRPVPDGANTPDLVNGTDFGEVAAGAFVDRTYTIANTGTVPLSLTNGVQVSGAQASEFTVVTAPAPQVASGGSTALTIRFQPLASGPRSARISLSNSSDKSPYDFAVQGTGGP